MSNANIFTCPSIFISSLTTQAKSRLPKCGGPEAAAIPDPPTCVKCRQRVAIEPCRDIRNKFKQIVSFWELGRCLSRKELFLAHTRNKRIIVLKKNKTKFRDNMLFTVTICLSRFFFFVGKRRTSFKISNDITPFFRPHLKLKFPTFEKYKDRRFAWNDRCGFSI